MKKTDYALKGKRISPSDSLKPLPCPANTKEVSSIREFSLLEGDSTRKQHKPLITVSEEWIKGKSDDAVSLSSFKKRKDAEERLQDREQMALAKSIVLSALSSDSTSNNPVLASLFNFGMTAMENGRTTKPKDRDHTLYLVRLTDQSHLHTFSLSADFPVSWRDNPFIPVIGFEVKKSKKAKFLHEVSHHPATLRLKEVEMLHDYSFAEI